MADKAQLSMSMVVHGRVRPTRGATSLHHNRARPPVGEALMVRTQGEPVQDEPARTQRARLIEPSIASIRSKQGDGLAKCEAELRLTGTA